MAQLSPEPGAGAPRSFTVHDNERGFPMAIEQVKVGGTETPTVPKTKPAAAKAAKTAKPKVVKPAEEAEPEVVLSMPEGKISDYLVDEIENIPLHALVSIDDPEHPLYDPRAEKTAGSQEFLDSFKEHGQLRPGIVFPTGNGKFVILEGNQRKAGIVHAGGKVFKAQRVKPEIGDLGAVYLQIATNALRTDDSLEARGKRMKHMLKLNGGNMLDTAKAFGVTKETVRNAVKLQDADPTLRKAVADKIIKETTAVKIVTDSKGDKEAQKKAATKAREMSQKLGDAKIATKIKAEKGAKVKPPKAISAATLLGRAPSKILIREVVTTAELGKEADTLLRWVVGELDTEAMLGLVPSVKKVWNELENAPFKV